jgi:hypothetical protein
LTAPTGTPSPFLAKKTKQMVERTILEHQDNNVFKTQIHGYLPIHATGTGPHRDNEEKLLAHLPLEHRNDSK